MKLATEQQQAEERIQKQMDELKQVKEQIRAKSALDFTRNDEKLEQAKPKKKKRRVVSVRRFRVNSDGSRTMISSVPRTAKNNPSGLIDDQIDPVENLATTQAKNVQKFNFNENREKYKDPTH